MSIKIITFVSVLLISSLSYADCSHEVDVIIHDLTASRDVAVKVLNIDASEYPGAGISFLQSMRRSQGDCEILSTARLFVVNHPSLPVIASR